MHTREELVPMADETGDEEIDDSQKKGLDIVRWAAAFQAYALAANAVEVHHYCILSPTLSFVYTPSSSTDLAGLERDDTHGHMLVHRSQRGCREEAVVACSHI